MNSSPCAQHIEMSSLDVKGSKSSTVKSSRSFFIPVSSSIGNLAASSAGSSLRPRAAIAGRDSSGDSAVNLTCARWYSVAAIAASCWAISAASCCPAPSSCLSAVHRSTHPSAPPVRILPPARAAVARVTAATPTAASDPGGATSGKRHREVTPPWWLVSIRKSLSSAPVSTDHREIATSSRGPSSPTVYRYRSSGDMSAARTPAGCALSLKPSGPRRMVRTLT